VTALNRKIAALKGTRGLHIVGTSTVKMKSEQGRLTVSTVGYTYRSGNATRWVATRYVGPYGTKSADIEISTAGSTTDSKLLGRSSTRRPYRCGWPADVTLSIDP
jgi:hypothetical protein